MSKVRCKQCKEYLDKDDAFQVGLSHYCSQDHFYDSMSAKEKRAKRSSFRQGKASNPMPPSTRNHVLKRDGFRCIVCKRGLTEQSAEVHHIRYKSETGGQPDHSPSNLATLCYECHHNVVHKDKKTWQPKLLNYASMKEAKQLRLDIDDGRREDDDLRDWRDEG